LKVSLNKEDNKMEVKQFNYSTRDEAIEKAPLDFIKSFYFRPDGFDREWEQYKLDEQSRLDEFKKVLSKEQLMLSSILIVYHDSMEISAIIEFEEGHLQDSTRKELTGILVNDEQYNDVMIVGVDVERFVFGESY
jgi:hypothetical protein